MVVTDILYWIVSQRLKEAIFTSNDIQNDTVIIRNGPELSNLSNEVKKLVIDENVELDNVVIDGYDNLQSIVVRDNSLRNIASFSLTSLIDLNQLIWSSSINYIHYRIWFILLHNFIEFDQFDWFESTHLIFLN